MESKESEYRELFLLEARDNLEELDNLFVDLEKDHANKEAIESIFRITHTIKGNAMGLGLDAIADLSHVMEDVMIAIKSKKVEISSKLFDLLFRANDKLGALVQAINTEDKVSFLGVKTSLSLYLKNQLEKEDAPPEEEQTAESAIVASTEDNEEDEPQESSSQIAFSEVVQIPIKKMDDLLNQVGQLIIERDRLMTSSAEIGVDRSQFDSLQRITSNLQYSIMNVRMVQVGFLFNKFHRVLRDAGNIEKKRVNLELKGSEIEIDRNILKIISDSLVHLVRNAVGHGIESEEVRQAYNKNPAGTVTLDARYERDRVVITVKDDGAGIDHEVIRKKIVEKGLVPNSIAKNLSPHEVILNIFEPGFSNADQVNEISGRGVGMDVVKKAVESIGGQVSIHTTIGEGSIVELHLPSSLALKATLLFRVANQEYGIALAYTESVISLASSEIYKLSSGLMTKYQQAPISVVFLEDILRLRNLKDLGNKGVLHRSFDKLEDDEVLNVIITNYSGRLMGVVVDSVLQQKDIMEKPLAKPLQGIRIISGTTILGNGSVCPIVDMAALSDIIYKQSLKGVRK